MRTKNIPTPYQADNSKMKSMAVFFVFAIFVTIVILSAIPPLWVTILAPIALGVGILALGCCAFVLSGFFGRTAKALKISDQASAAPKMSDPASEVALSSISSPISKGTMSNAAIQTTTPDRRPNASAASNQTVNPARGNWFGSFFSPLSMGSFSLGRGRLPTARSEVSSIGRKMESTVIASDSDRDRGFQTLSPDVLATLQAARAKAAERVATGSSVLTTPPPRRMITEAPTTTSARALQRWSDAPPGSAIHSLGLGSVGSAVSPNPFLSPTAVQRLDFKEPNRVQMMAPDAGGILASQAKAAVLPPEETVEGDEEEDPYADYRRALLT